jgi:hypothetical protein
MPASTPRSGWAGSGNRSITYAILNKMKLTHYPKFSDAEATGCSTLDPEVSVSQILEHHALGVEE